MFRPEELWREQRGIPPDLIVYFGDLGWRSNGSLGHGRHWTYDNDTGPDDANHDRDGHLHHRRSRAYRPSSARTSSSTTSPRRSSRTPGLPPDESMRGRIIAATARSL